MGATIRLLLWPFDRNYLIPLSPAFSVLWQLVIIPNFRSTGAQQCSWTRCSTTTQWGEFRRNSTRPSSKRRIRGRWAPKILREKLPTARKLLLFCRNNLRDAPLRFSRKKLCPICRRSSSEPPSAESSPMCEMRSIWSAENLGSYDLGLVPLGRLANSQRHTCEGFFRILKLYNG